MAFDFSSKHWMWIAIALAVVFAVVWYTQYQKNQAIQSGADVAMAPVNQ